MSDKVKEMLRNKQVKDTNGMQVKEIDQLGEQIVHNAMLKRATLAEFVDFDLGEPKLSHLDTLREQQRLSRLNYLTVKGLDIPEDIKNPIKPTESEFHVLQRDMREYFESTNYEKSVKDMRDSEMKFEEAKANISAREKVLLNLKATDEAYLKANNNYMKPHERRETQEKIDKITRILTGIETEEQLSKYESAKSEAQKKYTFAKAYRQLIETRYPEIVQEIEREKVKDMIRKGRI